MEKNYIVIVVVLFCVLRGFSQNVSAENVGEVGMYMTDKGQPRDISVKKLLKEGLIVFKADLDMDLDGCPFAYKPDNKGLCNNGNAKGSAKSGFSKNVLLHDGDKPVIQDAKDKAPGYYISMTSLRTDGKENTTASYVDALEVPYVVMPSGMGIERGDIVLVYNTKNDRYSFAINGDGNNTGIIGEGSAKLIKNLGLPLLKLDYYHCDKCSHYNYSKTCKICKEEQDVFCEDCKMMTTHNDGKDFIFIAFPNSAKLLSKDKMALADLSMDAINSRGQLQVDPYGDVATLIIAVKSIL